MKKLLVTMPLAVIFGLVGLALSAQHAYAYVYPKCGVSLRQDAESVECCGNGQGNYSGYINPKHYGSANCNVLFGDALKNVKDAKSFIDTITYDLTRDNPWWSPKDNEMNHKGAAFIINTMLGKPAGTSGVSAADLSQWKALVNYYAASGNTASYGVEWYYKPGKVYYCSSNNPGYRSGQIETTAYSPHTTSVKGTWTTDKKYGNLPGDDIFWGQSCGDNYTDSMPEVRFYWDGGRSSFQIGKQCGNVQNIFDKIPPPPTLDLKCGSLLTQPEVIDPYMGFSVTPELTYNASAPSPPSDTKIVLRITPPAASGYVLPDSYMSAKVSGGLISAIYNTLGPPKTTGAFTATWTVSSASSPYVDPPKCSGTLEVVNLPYLSVYGGDVMTGASPSYKGGASTCMVDTDGGIFGWNNVNAKYAGAGTQYAVQALGAIQNFAAGLGSSGRPAGLAFANSYTPNDPSRISPPQGLFGGYFAEPTADCDFTSDLKDPQTSKADKTFGTTVLRPGTNDVWLVTNADVYISGKIAYAGTGGWRDISQIPYFKLVVVGGDIYIGKDVTQLDGVYVAEPDSSGKHGKIYTCATGVRAAVDPTSAGYYAECHAKLTVNGVFVAKQVQLLRTNGSLGQAAPSDSLTTNHSAEVFNYTPELWLPRGANLPASGYTAITGLPPIL